MYMLGKTLLVSCMALSAAVFWHGKEGIRSGMTMIGDTGEAYSDKVNKGVEGGG